MPAVTAPIQSLAATAPGARRGRGDADPLSHAVRISFAAADEAARAAERFEAAARSCWPLGAAGRPRLWHEDVAAASTGAKAVRRRSTELSWAIGRGVQPPLRGVLLRYRDGRAEMIITCHRAFLSEAHCATSRPRSPACGATTACCLPSQRSPRSTRRHQGCPRQRPGARRAGAAGTRRPVTDLPAAGSGWAGRPRAVTWRPGSPHSPSCCAGTTRSQPPLPHSGRLESRRRPR